jgi:hypothetical protein
MEHGRYIRAEVDSTNGVEFEGFQGFILNDLHNTDRVAWVNSGFPPAWDLWIHRFPQATSPIFYTIIRLSKMLAYTSNAARTLTIATLVWLIAIVYCKINFYQDPGSAFFDENRAFTRYHSAYREEQSVKFLERSSEHPQKASASPSMCAVFLSVKRTGEQPLDVSIGSRASSAYRLER